MAEELKLSAKQEQNIERIIAELRAFAYTDAAGVQVRPAVCQEAANMLEELKAMMPADVPAPAEAAPAEEEKPAASGKKTITRDKLDEMLRKHSLWLNDKEGGVQANFSGLDLHGMVLLGADLRKADMRFTDLSGCDMRFCDLREADMRYSNIQKADMRYTLLAKAWMLGAHTEGTNFEHAHTGGLNYRKC